MPPPFRPTPFDIPGYRSPSLPTAITACGIVAEQNFCYAEKYGRVVVNVYYDTASYNSGKTPLAQHSLSLSAAAQEPSEQFPGGVPSFDDYVMAAVPESTSDGPVEPGVTPLALPVEQAAIDLLKGSLAVLGAVRHGD